MIVHRWFINWLYIQHSTTCGMAWLCLPAFCLHLGLHPTLIWQFSFLAPHVRDQSTIVGTTRQNQCSHPKTLPQQHVALFLTRPTGATIDISRTHHVLPDQDLPTPYHTLGRSHKATMNPTVDWLKSLVCLILYIPIFIQYSLFVHINHWEFH